MPVGTNDHLKYKMKITQFGKMSLRWRYKRQDGYSNSIIIIIITGFFD